MKLFRIQSLRAFYHPDGGIVIKNRQGITDLYVPYQLTPNERFRGSGIVYRTGPHADFQSGRMGVATNDRFV